MTFTLEWRPSTIQFVVWQFWGRAAEASWTQKVRALFHFALVSSGAKISLLSTRSFEAKDEIVLGDEFATDIQRPQFCCEQPKSDGAIKTKSGFLRGCN